MGIAPATEAKFRGGSPNFLRRKSYRYFQDKKVLTAGKRPQSLLEGTSALNTLPASFHRWPDKTQPCKNVDEPPN